MVFYQGYKKFKFWCHYTLQEDFSREHYCNTRKLPLDANKSIMLMPPYSIVNFLLSINNVHLKKTSGSCLTLLEGYCCPGACSKKGNYEVAWIK